MRRNNVGDDKCGTAPVVPPPLFSFQKEGGVSSRFDLNELSQSFSERSLRWLGDVRRWQ
jgi:hypothetical protein